MEKKETVALEKKTVITLRSSDGEMFEVEAAVFMEFQAIKPMLKEGLADGDAAIPLFNVSGQTLSKVIEFCKKHIDHNKLNSDEEIRAWDKDFINVDQKTLFDLMLASNFLNVKSLFDLTCNTLADMMRGKTPEQIRKTFHIKNDYTLEEEEEVRRENHWAFE